MVDDPSITKAHLEQPEVQAMIANGTWKFTVETLGGNHTVHSSRMAYKTISRLGMKCQAFREGYHHSLMQFTGRVFTWMDSEKGRTVSHT